MTTHASKSHEPRPEAGTLPGAKTLPVHVRPATKADIPALVPLILRLKRLNEEFDPLLRVRSDAEAKASEVLAKDIDDPEAVVFVTEGVGTDKDRAVGVIRARVRERPFYSPEREGVILDIYLLPLYRRRGVGEYLLEEITNALKAKGAGVITAEFPFQNQIATAFYHKRGFRPTIGHYSRQL